MVVVPAPVPVTSPVPLTVATPTATVLQTPPAGVVVHVTDCPTQIGDVPVIGLGSATAVTTVVAMQPEGGVYVIVAVPAVPAVHVPVEAPMLADAPLDDHVPPGVAQLRVALLPWHKVVVPVIGAVVGFTVSVATDIQPPGSV